MIVSDFSTSTKSSILLEYKQLHFVHSGFTYMLVIVLIYFIQNLRRAVSFVMYMPLKPIKHGIKVFCICCSYSAMLLSFVIYVEKD